MSPRWKILSPDASAGLARVLVAACSLAVVTCAGAAREVVTPAPPATVAPPPAPSGSAAPAPESPAPTAAPAERPLARFDRALAALASGERKAKVRVLWFGDSHTAADFWPDALRRPLQAAHGNGGPGFLHLGLGAYRHAGVALAREGRFHVQPRQPSLWTRQDDGVFGLGGIRTVPEGAAARVSVVLGKDAVRGGATWDLAYRLPRAASRLVVTVQGGESHTLVPEGGAGAILHHVFHTAAEAHVTVERAAEEPELLGVTVESDEPGVVVDTLGINGARIATPLAWDEASWADEVKRRTPALFVLAYGTNEVGDKVDPQKYGAQVEELVGRLRRAEPGADCVVIGPTDRGDLAGVAPRVGEIDAVERAAAARAGCAFWSARDAMGGEGGILSWAALSPPLASSDRIHLTARGYADLGGRLVEALFAGSLGPR